MHLKGTHAESIECIKGWDRGTKFFFFFLEDKKTKKQGIKFAFFFKKILSIVDGSDGKESAYNVGDSGSIPGSGRSLGEGNGNPVQFSCLGNPMDRGDWWTTVHGVEKSQT